MSEEEIHSMKIDNLIFRLNNLAIERMEIFDKLWQLEKQGENLRLELLKQMKAKSLL